MVQMMLLCLYLIMMNALETTIDRDNTVTKEEALVEILQKTASGDPPTVDNAKQLFRTAFILILNVMI